MVNQLKRSRRATPEIGTRALAFIGRQDWLDRPSYRLENVLSFAFNALGKSRNRVTNLLNGVWLGHPAHPPLASLASGAIGTTVALDVLHALPHRPAVERIDSARFAQNALAIGILANLGSAATGVTDWQHTHEQDRRVGLVHGLLNLVATSLYIASWRDRRRGHHLRGMAVSAIGYGIATGSGYLGGSLVFGSGIGIDQSGPRLHAPDWTPVLAEASLPPGELQRVEVDGIGIVVCRNDDDGVTAVGAHCPHLAAPMSDGWLDRGRIVCPWHGSQFDVQDGHVVRGPAAAPLPCYQARLHDGKIEVRSEGELTK
ncbi:Rieske 2Fe-2S domain-containing protein [Mycobacterium vicinigordonae]|uniref:Rieske 2Fe-2S domain-containing protein n=1 Tax=Mycobacterium vicinigordonae TaxID=1719132 RepID=A0A7D6I1P8_9MYCO|nr:Rieske 2Fe-2S domain-containing protein [Mycobacterium vicinigordonae]QLL08074.1 Rieske 2Fe-2S domain-containing protein [Mycobacterium vicinigordonae]